MIVNSLIVNCMNVMYNKIYSHRNHEIILSSFNKDLQKKAVRLDILVKESVLNHIYFSRKKEFQFVFWKWKSI